ncbi:putative aconitase/putative aconitase with swiveling domain [Aquamicrobium terrae]
MIRAANACAAGEAEGVALVLSQELSFWGGLDAATGCIIDRSHPDLGKAMTGRILVMAGGRGSSSSSSVLAEAIRLGTGPAGIVLARPDPIITVGALVAALLYGTRCPVVVCPIDGIATGDRLRIAGAGAGAAKVERLAAADG